MKTIRSTLTAVAGLLLLTACAADAQTAGSAPGYGPGYGPGFGPGWHRQQVSDTWQGGPPGPMMAGPMMAGPMMGRGMMMGSYAPKLGPDGKIDPASLPPWCPYAQTQAAPPATTGQGK